MEYPEDFDDNLIECVRNNKCFYNKHSNGYKNPVLKDMVWQQIALQLNCSVELCKQRWKSLRDRYVRERKKLMMTYPNEGHPTWPLYDSMDFLTEFITPKKRKGTNYSEDFADDESFSGFKEEDSAHSSFNIKYSEVIPKQERTSPEPATNYPSPPVLTPIIPSVLAPIPPVKKKRTSKILDEMDNNFVQAFASLKEYLQGSLENVDRDVNNFSETISRLYQELDEANRKKAKAHIIKYLGDMVSKQLSES